MQKRIFPVWGVAGVGKTTSLKLIGREIMRQYFSAKPTIPIEPLPKGDITVIILILLNGDEIKIGITSEGDPNTNLYTRLEELATEGCKYIFCATRTSGTTVVDVQRFDRDYEFKATWLTNYQSGFENERDFLNQKTAEHLVSLFESLALS
jgi:hypothetical protein